MFIWLSSSQDIAPGSCIEYSVGICIRCERETHLYNGMCYTNILGCTQYAEGANCVQCDTTSFVLSGTTCNPGPGVTITADLLATLYKYGGAQSVDPGSQYGEAGFIPVPFETVQKWPTFMALNTFVRVGQYSHFISRTGNPVYSVHYYIKDKQYSYKVLYYGSGGGLFLCIGDVPPTFKVNLRSLTPISSSNVIDFCIDYDENSNCLRCAANYHLESKKCYPNYGGCVKYRENICLECLNYYFLVENRCVSDCLSVSDARSLLYFEGSTSRSTLETYYGESISQFYSITVRNTTTTVVTSFTNNNIGGGIANSNSQSNSGFSTSSSSNTNTNSNSNSSSLGSSTSTTIIRTTTTTSSSTSGSSTPISNSGSSLSRMTLSLPSTLGQESSIDITPISGGNLLLKLNPNLNTSTSTTTVTSTSSTQQDPNCTFFGPDGLCIKCATFYYKNKANNNKCEAVSPFCATYDEDTGGCTTCYPGYELAGTECNVSL